MLSPIGLSLATGTSIVNVFADVARKKAMLGRNLFQATFWVRLGIALVAVTTAFIRYLHGGVPSIHPDANAAGMLVSNAGTAVQFGVYLFADVALIALSTWLYYRALQISPLSLVIPLLAFSPVFLLVSGSLLLGERLDLRAELGVISVVIGSIIMHRAAFTRGGLVGGLRTIFRERGVWYMLGVSLIVAISNPLDKRLVGMSDPYTQALCYSLALLVVFSFPLLLHPRQTLETLQSNWVWIALAGLLEGGGPDPAVCFASIHRGRGHHQHEACGDRAGCAGRMAVLQGAQHRRPSDWRASDGLGRADDLPAALDRPGPGPFVRCSGCCRGRALEDASSTGKSRRGLAV